MVRPKKHLGQHFLTDPGIARRIVDALEPAPGDVVIEIGPGTGVLTTHLLEHEIRLVPVEIDPESSRHLLEKWPGLSDNLVCGDILKMDLMDLAGEAFHVIGNFPYNISSQLLFRILDHRNAVGKVVCMLQKEVADRVTSPPGSKTYGILSVLLQAYFSATRLFTVKPGSFHPAPAVHSAVIRLDRNEIVSIPCDEDLFVRVVKTTFNQRRKTIRNSIRPILLNLDSSFELLNRRPEQLDVNQFFELTRWVTAQQQSQQADPPKDAQAWKRN